MSKIKSDKKVKSIVRELNFNFVMKTFLRFLFMDVIVICVAVIVWGIQTELSYFGNIAKDASRNFNIVAFNEATYTVISSSGKTMVAQVGGFMVTMGITAGVAFIVQIFMILNEIIFGRVKIRRILKPLNQISEMANRLSNLNFDENMVQDLEEAIAKVSPMTSGEKIHTGNSELKGLEEAINNLLERMRESYRQQARFVSDASHELRTPIAVIQGYANMLDRWGKEDESVLNESILAIKSESENMKNLVEQLLFLARGINGKTQLKYTEFMLSDMMNEVFEESKMIDVEHVYEYYPEGIIEMYADEPLLKQTVRILIENAAKYTDQGESIVLRTGKTEKGEPYISVQDNGIGMDSGDVCHIFDRFFRADTARARKTGGTGLGLSIAKWIVDNHRGYFSVISRKGIGTRITVYLPKK